ncbi:MAG: flavin reductase [Solirubrobacteraceae bacterium]
MSNTPQPEASDIPFDAQRFREVLGHYPTGVSVITAMGADGKPAGLAVGTFTSVSLDPPLVGFLPDKSSSSFPKIQAAGSFCVNVLAADQEPVCRALAAKGDDKFKGLSWHPAAATGSPIIDGAVAWIDCDIESVTEAGDHYVVIGRVRNLEIHNSTLPLLFFQGGYGRFSQHTRAAFATPDLVGQLRLVDVARDEMYRLATALSVECLAVSQVGEELVIVGSAGRPRSRAVPIRLGQRVPFIPPVGAAFIAWADDAAKAAWLDRAPDGDPALRAAHEQRLARVRERGWSLAVSVPGFRQLEAALFHLPTEGTEGTDTVLKALFELSDAYEPADLAPAATHGLNSIMAPVFGPDGGVVFALALAGLPASMTPAEIEQFAAQLVEAATTVGAALAAG